MLCLPHILYQASTLGVLSVMTARLMIPFLLLLVAAETQKIVPSSMVSSGVQGDTPAYVPLPPLCLVCHVLRLR